MKKDRFINCENLCDYMIDKAEEGYYVAAVLFYDKAMELLRSLLFYEDVEAESIELIPEQCNDYNKEYCVSIADDMVVSVEPLYVNGKYVCIDADITLIDGNASSAILINEDEETCCEISFIDDEWEMCNTCEYIESCESECREDKKAMDDLIELIDLIRESIKVEFKNKK